MEIQRTRDRILSFLPQDQGRLERVSRKFRADQLRVRNELMEEFDRDRQTLDMYNLMDKYWSYRELTYLLIQIDRRILFLTGIANNVNLEKLYKPEYKSEAFYTAALNGHLDLLKDIVNYPGETIDEDDIPSALNIAIKHGHLEAVKWLFSQQKSRLNTHLNIAIDNGQIKVAEYLISTCSNLNDILRSESFFGRLDMVKFLVSKGATDLEGALRNATKEKWSGELPNPYLVAYLQSEIAKRG
jgi:hypothetical protein